MALAQKQTGRLPCGPMLVTLHLTEETSCDIIRAQFKEL